MPSLPGMWSAPYDCKLRVNFHCWVRLGLQTSTVSPPILALRLSRQRLLPTWRSFELDSICSHFWTTNNTMSQILNAVRFLGINNNKVPRFQCVFTCLLSFSLQPCSLMREPAVLSTTVRHRSICFTDLSLVRAHSFTKMDTHKILVHVKHAGMFSARLYLIIHVFYIK